MTFTASTMRACKMLIATTFALAALGTAARPIRRSRSRCARAMRCGLCASEIPDVERVTACMVQKRAQLSDGCKAVFQYVPPAAATPVNYAPSAKPSRPLNLTPHKRG